MTAMTAQAWLILVTLVYVSIVTLITGAAILFREKSS